MIKRESHRINDSEARMGCAVDASMIYDSYGLPFNACIVEDVKLSPIGWEVELGGFSPIKKV